MLGGGPEMDVHFASIFGQPQKWMSNPVSISQPPHERGKGGGGTLWSRLTSQASTHRRYPLPAIMSVA